MKCAVEEGAEETFSLTQFITRRPSSSSSSKLLMSSLSVWVGLTAEEEEAPEAKSRCFLKNVSQRSSENTHVCTCTDAELQRRKLFIWDERWSLKKNVLHPGETADFLKRKQTGRVGEGWKGKITKNKKGEKVNPPRCRGFSDTLLCLFKWGRNGVWCGHRFLSSPPRLPPAGLHVKKYWKQKLVQINGRLFLPFVYFNDSFCVYARFQNGTFTCVLKESSSLFFPFSPTRNNFLWSAFSRNLNLRI